MKNFIDELNKLEFQFKDKLKALVLQDRFISEVDMLMEERKLNKKELAMKLGVSSSFITQVFKGKKFLNFSKLAKLQEIFNIEFKIRAVSKAEIERDTKLYCSDYFKVSVVKKKLSGNFHQVIKPNYNNFPELDVESETETTEKVA